MGLVLIVQVFILLWLIRAFKSALFWIYLWQLKEYHIGRFLDHFRTHKGKKLFFNFFSISKIVLITLAMFGGYAFYISFLILLAIYLAEFAIFIKSVVSRNLKIPKFTLKTSLLTSVSFALVISFLFWAAEFYLQTGKWQIFFIYLLAFDILSPLIISLAILVFQPFFVLARNNILEEAREKIKKFNMPGGGLTIIGITGSYGKTSTKEFLKTILSSKFNVLATSDHKNSEIGIAQTILEDLNENHNIFIVEMGAYNKGGIKLLCDIAKPKIGIVTGVNEQHLSTFGSMEKLLSAEGGRELVNSLPKGGMIILNGDNKYCLDLYKNIGKSYLAINKKIYTLNPYKIKSDIWTENVEVKKESLDFVAITKNKEMVHFDVDVLGKQNIQNLLAAVLAAKELGMSLEEISTACKNIRQEQAGIVLKSGVHGLNIIDSSYSSNPDGVMADLDYLKAFEGKKAVVMPCLIELGKKSAKIHEEIGKKIAEVCDMAIITTKDKFEEIKMGAVMIGTPEDKILLCNEPKDILSHITTICKEGDAVLLEGRVPSELINLLTK